MKPSIKAIAVNKGVRTLTLESFEVMPPVATNGEQRIGLVNQYHELARAGMAQSCAYMILAGVELLALKKDVAHGQWEGLFPEPGDKSARACAFGMSLRVAQKYMGFAAAGRKHVQALQAICESQTPLALMPPEQREELVQAVRKTGDGKTYSELADEWGIAKRKRGAGTKGGHNPGDGEGGTETDEEAALDVWGKIVKDIALEGVDHKSWAHLPDAGELTKRSIGELLVSVGQEMLAAAKKGAKRK